MAKYECETHGELEFSETIVPVWTHIRSCQQCISKAVKNGLGKVEEIEELEFPKCPACKVSMIFSKLSGKRGYLVCNEDDCKWDISTPIKDSKAEAIEEVERVFGKDSK